MLYRLKKDAHVRCHEGAGYITSTGMNKRNTVDESGAEFLSALAHEGQTLDTLADKLLAVFKGVDRETILPDAREFYDNLAAEGFLVKGESDAELDASDTSLRNAQPPQTPGSINFYLPGLDLSYLDFYIHFANYMRLPPASGFFMDNIRIASFYGAFNNTIWQGGRTMIGMQPSLLEMENAIQRTNDAGIAVRYTFTNSLIEERHLGDTYCNTTMELANNGKNEVLVNSPVLEAYLRKQYPNFKYILSTTACERNIDRINEATKKYDLVVIDFRDNHNMDFLAKIQDKDKIEIIANDQCPSSCRFRKKHYDLTSHVHCFQADVSESKCIFKDRKPYLFMYDRLETQKDTMLSFDEVYGKYYDMGFRHFKLVGRQDHNFDVFEGLMYYLTKPEARDMARAELADRYINCLIRFYGGNSAIPLSSK